MSTHNQPPESERRAKGAVSRLEKAAGPRPTGRKGRLQSIRAGTLPEQVAARIVEGIADGRWLPGERILETRLADELTVSRVPIRSALKALEKQGIVFTIPHRGTYVMDITEQKIRQAYAVRLDLELHACKATIKNVQNDPSRLDELREILEEMRFATESRDLKQFGAADLRFHKWLITTSGIDILATLWDAMSQHMQIYFSIVGEDWRDMETKYKEHCQMYNLIACHDNQSLCALLKHHIVHSFSHESDGTCAAMEVEEMHGGVA